MQVAVAGRGRSPAAGAEFCLLTQDDSQQEEEERHYPAAGCLLLRGERVAPLEAVCARL
jgi:hypothetical protein